MRGRLTKVRRTSRQSRKTVKRDDFALPEYAPGPRGYPIDTPGAAKAALYRAENYGEEGDFDKVKAAVEQKYPFWRD